MYNLMECHCASPIQVFIFWTFSLGRKQLVELLENVSCLPHSICRNIWNTACSYFLYLQIQQTLHICGSHICEFNHPQIQRVYVGVSGGPWSYLPGSHQVNDGPLWASMGRWPLWASEWTAQVSISYFWSNWLLKPPKTSEASESHSEPCRGQ